MKLKVFLLLCFLFLFSKGYSQDVITTKKGEDIEAKVIEVGLTEVKYKRIDNPDGPVFILLKSEILLIRYENGSKDIFTQAENTLDTTRKIQPETRPVETKVSSGDMCLQGRQDAFVNYHGHNTGAGWTLATTILTFPPIGLIPALACASSPPKDKNLNYKNVELMRDNKYNACYVEQAHKTKKKKIWRNFAIGSGIWLVFFALTR